MKNTKTIIPHIPVMLTEVIEQLDLKQGESYIDCTFGAGGYSAEILATSDVKLYSIDQDPSVKIFAEKLYQKHPDIFVFINDNFGNLADIAKEYNIRSVDGIVFDLGISSMQIDQAERGFSFAKEARLDMRMSQKGVDAWEVVNTFSESDIADIIYYYGEETFSRQIAQSIIKYRKHNPINTTTELAKIVQSSVRRTGKIDPATKTFQAIRVYVNDELKILKKALVEAYNLLNLEGKLVIVSFQGLEDRIIKNFISNVPNASAKLYKPKIAEIRENPRSRSAKIRTIIKKDMMVMPPIEGQI
ncbi:MAG: 16S rRNA (cytosine(1402)-N(4))-methyltransferase RsmH [Rickettsiales bacterium]